MMWWVRFCRLFKDVGWVKHQVMPWSIREHQGGARKSGAAAGYEYSFSRTIRQKKKCFSTAARSIFSCYSGDPLPERPWKPFWESRSEASTNEICCLQPWKPFADTSENWCVCLSSPRTLLWAARRSLRSSPENTLQIRNVPFLTQWRSQHSLWKTPKSSCFL